MTRLEELFTAHVEGVFNVAYRVLWSRSDAEDVVQSTFVKAAGHLADLRDVSRARAWLLQIGYREAIALLRHRRDIPTDPVSFIDRTSDQRGPAELAVASELATIVSEALAQMDPVERMAVVLRDIEQLPMKDVAAAMGLGLSAAKMRVHRGRGTLRVLLGSERTDAV
jgi:RNA polymerase sigma-70 factor (ECF subfamily)